MNDTDVYVVGSHCMPFGRWPNKSLKELTRQAYLGALADAGLARGDEIEAAWFGSCLMHVWGQSAIRGNVCFIPLVREGLFPDRAPIINVEGGCATGSLALAGAYKEIKAGDAQLTLAIGVEKLYDPVDPARVLAAFAQGMDQIDPQDWIGHYGEVARSLGRSFSTGPDRSAPMDTYAMQALLHMQHYGTTVEQIAYACAKNHNAGALNPNAQYRFTTTAEAVLADRLVSEPLTRSMCAPIGDGAAAALVCSGDWLRRQPPEVRARAIAIRGIGLAGGKYRALDEPGLSRAAADRAYRMAGIGPADIDVAEVHDATSYCELYQCEMLRLCGEGEGGPFVASGATALGGKVPVNTSGGLVSKGHPIGATGLSMCAELVTQLRGEAGPRQVEGASIAVQENGGGVIGLEEALAAVVVYGRS
ncbi:thiolase family protein [Vineibacter terrae]|uniref:thiolase family protein n=1 Tax=Vineibacter terrae TaxID=2586908 RepID=UPI002E349923|nr:thiolase family protein [Vineibacter terrae]HEX2892325.1 thiolase family protein [Vineibacter terrae]